MLDNLLDALAPGRFAISSDQDDVVNTLNGWKTQCADPKSFSLAENDEELRKRYLPEVVFEQTTRDRFSNQDAAYVRNAMLVRDLVDSTLLDERTDVERAVTLFYKVVHSVDLRETGPDTPEFGPYETAVFGWGTAADRTWLYAMMLRQLRLDAVVIRPKSAADDDSGPWLVGVIVPEDGIYLFDFHLGLPITSPSENDDHALPRNPVTFKSARENDAVFRQYDTRGAKYRLRADQLADVDVLAIGESSTWSPRLGLLQASLPTSLELFDGLSANSFREHGIIERLVDAGKDGLWNREAVGIWSYPDTIYRKALERTPQQLQQLQVIAMVMQAPETVSVKEQDGQPVLDREWSPENLHQARIRHLQGEYQSALTIYLKTRLAAQQIQGQPIYPNVYGKDWASYWAALVHFEQEDYLEAVESTGHTLRNPSPWNLAAKTLQAKSYALAEEPQLAEAADVLSTEPIRSPQYLGNQWLARRWERLANGESEAQPAETVATEEPKPRDASEPAPSPEEPSPDVPPEKQSTDPVADEAPPAPPLPIKPAADLPSPAASDEEAADAPESEPSGDAGVDH